MHGLDSRGSPGQAQVTGGELLCDHWRSQQIAPLSWRLRRLPSAHGAIPTCGFSPALNERRPHTSGQMKEYGGNVYGGLPVMSLIMLPQNVFRLSRLNTVSFSMNQAELRPPTHGGSCQTVRIFCVTACFGRSPPVLLEIGAGRAPHRQCVTRPTTHQRGLRGPP